MLFGLKVQTHQQQSEDLLQLTGLGPGPQMTWNSGQAREQEGLKEQEST